MTLSATNESEVSVDEEDPNEILLSRTENDAEEEEEGIGLRSLDMTYTAGRNHDEGGNQDGIEGSLVQDVQGSGLPPGSAAAGSQNRPYRPRMEHQEQQEHNRNQGITRPGYAAEFQSRGAFHLHAMVIEEDG